MRRAIITTINEHLQAYHSGPGLDERVLNTLMHETAQAIAESDLPVGCALTVGNDFVASDHNRVQSNGGLRHHAERNLLSRLINGTVPAGRRVLWVTLEPCILCAQAIQRFGVDEVVYVLDDPFRGGKALLAQAGIAVTQRVEWSQTYLPQVMEFYARYPEFCASRQFRYARDAWQTLHPTGRSEQLKGIFVHHLAPYLIKTLNSVPASQHDAIRQQFTAHMDALTSMAMRECAGIPTLAFVKDLHRALFPANFRHHAVGSDGAQCETDSGEWRRHALGPHYTAFSPAQDVESDLGDLLDRLRAKAALQREDALSFIFDFWAIHPFTDGNGRLACILADLLCVVYGLGPLGLDRKNKMFYTALMENLSGGASVKEQLQLVDAWNQGKVEIKPTSIYDMQPSAFQTYLRRADEKQHVVEQVLATLSDRDITSPLVIADIGAGTGAVAAGVMQRLLAQKRTGFAYHFVEPSKASIAHFRKHTPDDDLSPLVFHAMAVEDFLLPPSDLILLVQTLQYVENLRECLRNIVAALKPGGLALIVCSHPDSDEWRMLQRLKPARSTYERIKEVFDIEHMGYDEVHVESSVRVSEADEATPEGDDLLAFYFNTPATQLRADTKEAFWNGLSGFSREGLIRKKEAFFWIGGRSGGGGGADSMNGSLPPEARPYWNLRYTAFPRWDDGIQADWQGLHSVKPEVLALQLAKALPAEVVLDAFCGIGSCAIAFARSGKQVVAVEIDEHRLDMARNNARVYGVEDKITFIHGDVTQLTTSLHYDAAYFDPPWGGVARLHIAQMGWNDLSPNPLPLIHAALTKCNHVALSVPVNFSLADLQLDEYATVLQKAEMDSQWWYTNAFYRNR